MTRLLQPIAGVAVADRQHEKAEPDGEQDQVHHPDAPSDIEVSSSFNAGLNGGQSEYIKTSELLVAPSGRDYVPQPTYVFEMGARRLL
jgi:hypothetical protein